MKFVITCDRCQRTGNISNRYEMSQNGIPEVELFNIWRIDFMRSFPPSYNNLYILVTVNYVSKWVEAIVTTINDSKVVIKVLCKNIFTRFGTLRALLSDNGTHFCNKPLELLLKKYGYFIKSVHSIVPR